MKTFLSALFVLAVIGLVFALMVVFDFGIWKGETSVQPVQWEHGWKTDRVIATRYNGEVGVNIGFQFPQNPNDCDRAELNDFMAAYKGSVYQSGGAPGAEMFVVFKDVADRASADEKIKAMLPALSQFITDLGDGRAVKIPAAAQ